MNNKHHIDCIGEDFKLHVCTPDASRTKCGIKIRVKNPPKEEKISLYSCYECTY